MSEFGFFKVQRLGEELLVVYRNNRSDIICILDKFDMVKLNREWSEKL